MITWQFPKLLAIFIDLLLVRIKVNCKHSRRQILADRVFSKPPPPSPSYPRLKFCMDLEEFETEAGNGFSDEPVDDRAQEDASVTLNLLDHWWAATSRRGRWMDLIGDYAGSEPFILDGVSYSSIRIYPLNWRYVRRSALTIGLERPAVGLRQ